MYSESQIPAWAETHTTSTRKTMPAVAELAPSQTSSAVVAATISVPMNQWNIPRESESPSVIFIR